MTPPSHQAETGSSPRKESSEAHVELVRRTWATALNHNDFSDDDNFFNIGGHSMLGIALMKELESALGVRLPVRLLFDNPTVGGLAAALPAQVEDPGGAR
ncbi:acyl carrier protein [Streptomyces xiangluensis]|uniref:Acyl carrier protein n=1 Tax=Streptomyces xiangluensis TaxID=2665720 RepID=A0ABV8YQ27_9ACTN